MSSEADWSRDERTLQSPPSIVLRHCHSSNWISVSSKEFILRDSILLLNFKAYRPYRPAEKSIAKLPPGIFTAQFDLNCTVATTPPSTVTHIYAVHEILLLLLINLCSMPTQHVPTLYLISIYNLSRLRKGYAGAAEILGSRMLRGIKLLGGFWTWPAF